MTNYLMNKQSTSYVKFYPYLQNYYNSIKMPILIGKLEYWFSREKFSCGFFKFIEPCENFLYKAGDSWCEELSLGRKTFNKLFDIVGTRYKSKTLFLKEKEPFKGKLYASYFDRKKNKMFFIRNHTYANEFFHNLRPLPAKKVELEKNVENSENEQSFFQSKNLSSNSNKCRSSEKNSLDIYIQKNTNNISSIETKLETIKMEKTKIENKNDILEKMLAIWEKRIGSNKIWNKIYTFKKLKRAFISFFESSLKKWEAFCLKIASSKFLMGEKGSFKICLDYAIKPEGIIRILEDGFTFGDRDTETEDEKKEHEKKQTILNLHLKNLMENKENEIKKNKLLEEFLMTSPNEKIVQSIKNNNLRLEGFPKIVFESFIRDKITEKLSLNETY